MSPLILAVTGENELIALVILASVAISIVGMSAVYYHNKNKLREKTKQELAAYVAEGSITPVDAERILKAGNEDD
ncbi:MAG: hypothetical protein AB8F26_12600 [Phycisphaerales bacterium]